MAYLLLGKIVKPHGLNGAVKVFSHTDFPELRYQKGHVVFLFDGKDYLSLTVNTFFKQGNFDVVTFKDYDNIEKINSLLNKELFIKKEDAVLPNNHYHYDDLINCKIINDNQEVGIVKEVLDYPANYCLRCMGKDHKTFDLPFVDEFILKVDIAKKTVKVKLIEGVL